MTYRLDLKLNQDYLQISFTNLSLYRNQATQFHLFKGQGLSQWTLGEKEMAHYFQEDRSKERLSYAWLETFFLSLTSDHLISPPFGVIKVE